MIIEPGEALELHGVKFVNTGGMPTPIRPTQVGLRANK